MITKIHCSFCGAHHNDRKLTIVKDNNTICNECVADCEEIIEKEGDYNNGRKPRVPIYEKLREFDNVYKLTGSIFKS